MPLEAVVSEPGVGVVASDVVFGKQIVDDLVTANLIGDCGKLGIIEHLQLDVFGVGLKEAELFFVDSGTLTTHEGAISDKDMG